MREVYNNNIQWLKDNPARCQICKDASLFEITYKIFDSKEVGIPSLMAQVKDSNHTIHSQMYPMKEAAKIAESTDFQKETLIILGFGLGYVAVELRKKYPEKKIILIEPDIKLFYQAIKYVSLEMINFEKLYIGYKENITCISDNCDLYIQKSQERLFGNLYNRITNYINKKSIYNLSDQWRYKKFVSERCRIIFIDSSYVLTKECLSAIKNTGNLVHYIHIDIDSCDYEQFIKKLMNDISQFKPDFVLTINHLGFDKEGKLAELFSSMELPFVSWFVDSPDVILSSFEGNVSDFCNIFVWDDDYITEVLEKGYKNCDYLPLATDTNIFYPKEMGYLHNVSFVGSSMVFAIHKNMKSWCHRDDLIKLFPETVTYFLSLKSRHVVKSLEYLSGKGISFDNDAQRVDFQTAILWKATQKYRQSGIDKLVPFMPIIAGDPNWSNILPLDFEILRERWYYEDLVDYYNQSKINFNMTSLQMTNAINQRIFDVSACKRFILTDYRKQIDELFDGKKNIVYFTDVNEIPDLIDYYLKNDDVRNKYCNNAFNLVLNNHTYAHRVKHLVTIMKKRYK